VLVTVILASCAPTVTPEAELATAPAVVNPTLAPTVTSIPKNTPTPTPIPSSEINPEDLEGIVVRFAHPWIGETAQQLEDIARKFSQTNPWAIQVEVLPHGGETALVDALQAYQVAGEVPGLIAAHPYLLSGLADEIDLVDLGEYFDDPEWGFTADEQADILPVFMAPFSQDEQIWGLPFTPQTAVLFYNRTWGEALGFSEPPTNLDAFKVQTCEAAFANWSDDNPDTDGTGGWMINLDPNVLASWYYAFDGVIPGDDIPSFNHDIGQDTFNYLWDIKIQGCSWFARQPDPYWYFGNRYALMVAARTDQIPIQASWMDVTGSEDEWDAIGFPGVTGESIVVDGPGLLVIDSSPEEQLAAWLFAKHLVEPEVQAALVRSLFSLPVRASAMNLLTDFEAEYPQWAQAAALVDSASALPVSDAWGVAQWVLQDAAFRILQAESEEVPGLIEQLDAMIVDLTGGTP
jgi:multiple sugar transport system substrate-binding protein/sn-glycerol 3-phosphate transport system substrate-binding protein